MIVIKIILEENYATWYFIFENAHYYSKEFDG